MDLLITLTLPPLEGRGKVKEKGEDCYLNPGMAKVYGSLGIRDGQICIDIARTNIIWRRYLRFRFRYLDGNGR